MRNFVTGTLIAALFVSVQAFAFSGTSTTGLATNDLVEATEDQVWPVSDSTLESISYDAATHSLVLQLSYVGCEFKTHKLVIAEICQMTYPARCSATLKESIFHSNHCNIVQNETFVQPLGESFDSGATVLKVLGKTVLIEKK